MMSTFAHADGLVIVDGGRAENDKAQSVTITADGHIVVRTCGFLALDNSGTLVGPTGSVGCARALAVRSDNWVYMVSQSINHRPAIELTVVNLFTGELGGRRYYEPNYQLPNAIVFQPDETRLVVGGGNYFWPPLSGQPPYNDGFTMERFLTNAFQTDISFGVAETGKVDLDIEQLGEEYISKLMVRADGTLLASGVTQVGTGVYDAVLALYDRDGFPVTSFGTNGVVRLSGSAGAAVDTDSTGRIYLNVGGKLVTRLNSDGSPDTSFLSPNQPVGITVGDIKVDTSGRVVIFGTTGSAAPYQGYMARLTSTGALDVSFGGAGEVFLTAGQGVVESGGFGALDGGAKPVLALTVKNETDPGVPSTTDVAVFRYTASGTPDVSFGATQPDADYYPDPFVFANKVVPAGSANVMSDPVTITGVSGAAPISIEAGSAGTYVLGCDNAVPNTGRISAGQKICLMQDASSTPGAVVETRVNIGGRISSFTTTSNTELADAVPDPFTFVDEPNADLDATVESNTLIITGLTGRADATVTGGTIGCFTGKTIGGVAKVANGDRICVHHQSSKVDGRSVSTTLTIGGVSDTFTSTATTPDTTPDSFSFENRTGVSLNDGIVSKAVRINGINRPAWVYVTDGKVSIGCSNVFTADPVTITNGQELCLWHQSSSQPSTSTTTSLRIGGVTANFVSTTAAAAQPNPPSNGGGSGGGGALDWLSLLGLGGLIRRALRRSQGLPG
jgi:uncharacterized delta-60 repeat protein